MKFPYTPPLKKQNKNQTKIKETSVQPHTDQYSLQLNTQKS